MRTDVLIIGSGIGGLTAAIHLAQARADLRVTVLTKTEEEEAIRGVLSRTTVGQARILIPCSGGPL